MYEFFCCCRQHTNNTSVKTGRRVFIETSKPKEERNKKRKKNPKKNIFKHTHNMMEKVFLCTYVIFLHLQHGAWGAKEKSQLNIVVYL